MNMVLNLRGWTHPRQRRDRGRLVPVFRRSGDPSWPGSMERQRQSFLHLSGTQSTFFMSADAVLNKMPESCSRKKTEKRHRRSTWRRDVVGKGNSQVVWGVGSVRSTAAVIVPSITVIGRHNGIMLLLRS